MTTRSLEVEGLFSALDAHGLERQIKRIIGVGRVLVNPISGSMTVVFDPETTNLGAIQAAIKECGFHCAGEALPRHICNRRALPGSLLSGASSRRNLGTAALGWFGFASPREDVK